MRTLACLVGSFALGAVACSGGKRDIFGDSPPPVAMAGSSGQAGSGSGSGGASGGSGMSGSGGSAGALSCEYRLPGAAPIRLLTHIQYDNTVFDLLGDSSRPAQSFPSENEIAGFSNNVSANQAVPRLIEGFQSAGEALSARAVASRLDAIAPCAAGADTTACGHAFARDFGARAFRRPLETAETAIYERLFDAYAAQGYAKAIEVTLRAILQSPQFVYRVDAARAPTPETGAVALDSYAMASRLSYFLTNGPPDAELLGKAAVSALTSASEIEAQTLRLLSTPRAREMAGDFVGQWLGLSRLNGAARVAPDVELGPTDLVDDWQASFSAFVGDAIWTQGTAQALFTSPKIFVTPALASLYGVQTSATEGLVSADVPNERAGLLTQPALMALLAHSDQSAPVLRGTFVRERIMCLLVEPPPPDVNAIPPDVDPNATTRERFAQHTVDPNCAGCHVLIDGIGFAFEAYDQLGRYRTLENGLPIDTRGQVIETEEAALEGEITGAAELAARVALSPRVRDCLATQWYRYAMGRVEEEADQCSLADAKQRFSASNGNFRELLLGIVLSDAFRYRPALEAAE
jgi:hypothetical protein